MFRFTLGPAMAALIALTCQAGAQSSAPQVATKKVDGTDNVYMVRYGGHQSIFIVTPQGVIVGDPISYLRPETGPKNFQTALSPMKLALIVGNLSSRCS